MMKLEKMDTECSAFIRARRRQLKFHILDILNDEYSHQAESLGNGIFQDVELSAKFIAESSLPDGYDFSLVKYQHTGKLKLFLSAHLFNDLRFFCGIEHQQPQLLEGLGAPCNVACDQRTRDFSYLLVNDEVHILISRIYPLMRKSLLSVTVNGSYPHPRVHNYAESRLKGYGNPDVVYGYMDFEAVYSAYIDSLKLLFDFLRDKDIFESFGLDNLVEKGYLTEERFKDMQTWAFERDLLTLEDAFDQTETYFSPEKKNVEAPKPAEETIPTTDFFDLLETHELHETNPEPIFITQGNDYPFQEQSFQHMPVSADWIENFYADEGNLPLDEHEEDQESHPRLTDTYLHPTSDAQSSAAQMFHVYFRHLHSKFSEDGFIVNLLRGLQVSHEEQQSIAKRLRFLTSRKAVWRKAVSTLRSAAKDLDIWKPTTLADIFPLNLVGSAIVDSLGDNMDGHIETKDIFLENLSAWRQYLELETERLLYDALVQDIWGVTTERQHTQTEYPKQLMELKEFISIFAGVITSEKAALGAKHGERLRDRIRKRLYSFHASEIDPLLSVTTGTLTHMRTVTHERASTPTQNTDILRRDDDSQRRDPSHRFNWFTESHRPRVDNQGLSNKGEQNSDKSYTKNTPLIPDETYIWLLGCSVFVFVNFVSVCFEYTSKNPFSNTETGETAEDPVSSNFFVPLIGLVIGTKSLAFVVQDAEMKHKKGQFRSVADICSWIMLEFKKLTKKALYYELEHDIKDCYRKYMLRTRKRIIKLFKETILRYTGVSYASIKTLIKMDRTRVGLESDAVISSGLSHAGSQESGLPSLSQKEGLLALDTPILTMAPIHKSYSRKPNDIKADSIFDTPFSIISFDSLGTNFVDSLVEGMNKKQEYVLTPVSLGRQIGTSDVVGACITTNNPAAASLSTTASTTTDPTQNKKRKRHTSQSSYQCNICPRFLQTKQNLERHQSEVHHMTIKGKSPTKSDPCTKCGKAFSRDRYRIEHEKNCGIKRQKVNSVSDKA